MAIVKIDIGSSYFKLAEMWTGDSIAELNAAIVDYLTQFPISQFRTNFTRPATVNNIAEALRPAQPFFTNLTRDTSPNT